MLYTRFSKFIVIENFVPFDLHHRPTEKNSWGHDTAGVLYPSNTLNVKKNVS